MTASQGTPLEHLALVVKRLALLALRDCNNPCSSCQATPPGHCTKNRLKHIPSLSVKEAYLLVVELTLRARLQCTVRGLEGWVVCQSPSSLLQLTQKGVMVTSGAYTCGLIVPHTDHFKSCYLTVWLCISLNLSADWDLPLWDTDNTQVLEAIKNKLGCWDNHNDLQNKEVGKGWTVRLISYTRLLLQGWESWLFHLIHRN